MPHAVAQRQPAVVRRLRQRLRDDGQAVCIQHVLRAPPAGQRAVQARQQLYEGRLDDFGLLLHEAWLLKKQLATKISTDVIDELYDTAIAAGALGGKIAGAGGGGFLMLYCPRERQDAVREALHHLPELPFHLERDGTKVIFNYRR